MNESKDTGTFHKVMSSVATAFGYINEWGFHDNQASDFPSFLHPSAHVLILEGMREVYGNRVVGVSICPHKDLIARNRYYLSIRLPATNFEVRDLVCIRGVINDVMEPKAHEDGYEMEVISTWKQYDSIFIRLAFTPL